MQQQNKYKKYGDDMKNKIGKKQPGFEFNWKNKLAIWLVIVFIAMAIGQRSKISEKRYRDNVDEILLERNELEIPDLRRKKQG
jgi:hypothetical protein